MTDYIHMKHACATRVATALFYKKMGWRDLELAEWRFPSRPLTLPSQTVSYPSSNGESVWSETLPHPLHTYAPVRRRILPLRRWQQLSLGELARPRGTIILVNPGLGRGEGLGMFQADRDKFCPAGPMPSTQGPFWTNAKSSLNKLIPNSTKLLRKTRSQEESYNEWTNGWMNEWVVFMKRSMKKEEGGELGGGRSTT